MIKLFGQFYSPVIIISPKATTRVHITVDSLIWIPLCIYYDQIYIMNSDRNMIYRNIVSEFSIAFICMHSQGTSNLKLASIAFGV